MTESGQGADTLRQAGQLPQGRVASFSSEIMSVGQLGLVARLTLAYEGAGSDVPPTVMVRLPSTDGGSRAVGVALGIYESEVRFYQEIAPTVGIRVPQPHWATSNR